MTVTDRWKGISEETWASLLEDPEWVAKAMQVAVRAALREHKAAGNPVATVDENGKVILVPASEIHVPDESEFVNPYEGLAETR